jgi:hypothetical protein
MPGTDLDRRLQRLGEAAAAATTPHDPAATERAGRRRRRARRLGAALALAGLAAALVVRGTLLPRPEPDRPARPAPATRQVAHGGLVFSVPAGWQVSVGGLCPGTLTAAPGAIVDAQPDPPPPLGREIRATIGCGAARHPFALLRSLPDAQLPGATQRTVNGLPVRVRPVAPAQAVNLGRIPDGWSVWQALFPTQDGGLLLQVADRAGAELFEDVLASVRPGRDGGGAPGTRRLAWGGVSFEVPSAWQVVHNREDACAARSDAVVLGVDLHGLRCRLPSRYLQVTRLASPPSHTVRLNGFGVQGGSQGRMVGPGRLFEEDTAELADPPVRLRMVTVSSTSGVAEPPSLDAVLVSLRRLP